MTLSTAMAAHLRQLEAAGEAGVPERRLDSRTVGALVRRGFALLDQSGQPETAGKLRWRVHLTDAGRDALTEWRS